MPLDNTGSVGSATKAISNRGLLIGWNRARSMQGSLTASINRVTISGRDAAAGIDGTESTVSGLADLPVTVDDFTEQLAKQLGEEWQSGQKVFRFVPESAAQVVLDSDFITWNGARWKPRAIRYQSDNLFCVVVAAREE